MLIKSFSDFIKEDNSNSNSNVKDKIDEVENKKPEIIKKDTPKNTIEDNKKDTIKEKNEQVSLFEFVNNCVYFPFFVKPSKCLKMLTEKKISKDKLNYILINNNNDGSLIVLKYNENLKLNMDNLISGLFAYYKETNNTKEYNHIGTDSYCIIDKCDELIKNDIIKLLNK